MDANAAAERPMQSDTLAPLTMAESDGRSEVTGLIDNATTDRLYGWVWDAAHPGHRVRVELRLAGEPVASTIADIARPDLATHGIGDGCHAFEFPLLRNWFNRLRDLSAVAYGKDGSETLLAVNGRRQEDMLVPAQVTATLRHTTEALIAEHRVLRQELEATRARAAALPEAAEVEAIAIAGQELQRRIDSLELWITRLDGKLAEITVPTAPAQRGRIDIWQGVLMAIFVALLSVASTVIAMRHLG